MLDSYVLRVFSARLIFLILIVSLQQCLALSTRNETAIPSVYPKDNILQSIRTSVKQSIETGKSDKCHFHPIHAREEFFDHIWDGLIRFSYFTV
jgi:hypothetical protein